MYPRLALNYGNSPTSAFPNSGIIVMSYHIQLPSLFEDGICVAHAGSECSLHVSFPGNGDHRHTLLRPLSSGLLEYALSLEP